MNCNNSIPHILNSMNSKLHDTNATLGIRGKCYDGYKCFKWNKGSFLECNKIYYAIFGKLNYKFN